MLSQYFKIYKISNWSYNCVAEFLLKRLLEYLYSKKRELDFSATIGKRFNLKRKSISINLKFFLEYQSLNVRLWIDKQRALL